jgi:hypothetical protein
VFVREEGSGRTHLTGFDIEGRRSSVLEEERRCGEGDGVLHCGSALREDGVAFQAKVWRCVEIDEERSYGELHDVYIPGLLLVLLRSNVPMFTSSPKPWLVDSVLPEAKPID